MTRWIVLALLLSACKPSASCPNGVPTDGSCLPADTGSSTAVTDIFQVSDESTWACLSDGRFPEGRMDDPAPRKTIPYTIVIAQPDLHFGAMTIIRSSATSSYFRMMVPVKNTGPRHLCFLRIENLEFTHGLRENQPYTYVHGSVANTGSSHTDTCLAPGASGFFGGMMKMDYDQIADASFDVNEVDDFGQPPDGLVRPSAYSVSDREAPVLSEHILGDTVTVSDRATWLLRRASGELVTFGLADAPGPANLALGDSVTHTLSESYLEQSGSEICLFLDYDSPGRSGARSAACPEGLSPDACQAFLWEERNAREADSDLRAEDG